MMTQGIELGHFRIKAGVTEDTLYRSYEAMIRNHLSQQPGWRQQHLVKLQDGSFMDVAYAATQNEAMAICSSWQGRAECEAFLALIEPESMRFGTVMHRF